MRAKMGQEQPELNGTKGITSRQNVLSWHRIFTGTVILTIPLARMCYPMPRDEMLVHQVMVEQR